MKSLKQLILKLFTPFQMWLQRRGYVESAFTSALIDHLMSIARPGDILGSFESGRWTSMFIKGEYDHVAMVTDKMEVVEAVGDMFVDGKNLGGVRIVPLEEWLWKKNQVFILRHKNSFAAIQASKAYHMILGHSYDYTFDRHNEKTYCSEVPYFCYKTCQIDFLHHIPEDKDILPIDYLACTDLELMHDTRRTKFFNR